jgi:hypothetical protein
MFDLPHLDLEEIPLRFDSLGRLEFAGINNEAVLANFAVHLRADADGTWEITGIYMGTQQLLRGTELYRRCFQQIEAEHAGAIHDHVQEHLDSAIEGAHLDFSYDKTKFVPSELEVA